MAGKLFPLMAAGAAAFVLTKSKAKKKKKSSSKTSGSDAVASGTVERVFPVDGVEFPTPFEWRVRKIDGEYVAETGKKDPRSLKVLEWTEVGNADNLQDAKDLAWAYIDNQPGFEFASSAVHSERRTGMFDMVVRTGEYSEPDSDVIESGYIGNYRLHNDDNWVEAVHGPDLEKVRLLTLETAAIAAGALGGGDQQPLAPVMQEFLAACQGEIAVIDVDHPIGTHPYCPSAGPGQTVTAGASENGNRSYRVDRTDNENEKYVVYRNLGEGWKPVDSANDLRIAIIKGYNSIA